jgi:hypothetical protein
MERAIGQQSLRSSNLAVVFLKSCKHLGRREQGLFLPMVLEERSVLMWLLETSASGFTLGPLLYDDLSEMEEAHADAVRRREESYLFDERFYSAW